MSKLEVLIVPIILVILAAAWGVGYYYQHNGDFDEDEDEEEEKKYPEDYRIETDYYFENGYIEENSNETFFFKITDPNIISINFLLTWTDEATAERHINFPDEFALSIDPPDGKNISSQLNTSGKINLTFAFNHDEFPDFNGSYDYHVTIICGEAGDQESIIQDKLGIRKIQDDGNNWLLVVEYEHYVEKTK